MARGIDLETANPARVYDYLLGGDANFQADREMAEKICSALPRGIDGARMNVRASRAFLRQTVRWLVSEAGVRQFLDIGTGIPNQDNVHAVAQETAPDSRIVYVDYDLVVLAHAHQLLRSTTKGAAAFVHGDLREPEKILHHAAETLDLAEPVALMLVAVLHYISDKDDPYGLVTGLLDALPSGSYLVMSHLASDVDPEEMAELSRRHTESAMPGTGAVRSHAEVSRFFDGLDLLEPGVVRLDQWPSHDDWWAQLDESYVVPVYGAVARKP